MPDAAPARGSCGLQQPAFCDDFEVPMPGGRGGDLDEREWSVARIDNDQNPTQGHLNAWPRGISSACGVEKMGILPDKRPASFYDPGTFWSGDQIDLNEPYVLGGEIPVTP